MGIFVKTYGCQTGTLKTAMEKIAKAILTIYDNQWVMKEQTELHQTG